MDLIDDIELEGQFMRRRRLLPLVVVVLATLVATIAVSVKEGSRNMRKRKRDVIPFYKRIINSNEMDCFDNPSTSSRRPKRKRGSIVDSLDSICEVIKDLSAGITAGLTEPLKVDRSSGMKNDAADVYKALKAIPDLSSGTMLDAYDTFLHDTAAAIGFLTMNEGERVRYIIWKFGGL